MNLKKPYRSDELGPEYLHEVTVKGRRLRKGMWVSVERGVNRLAGKYVFDYAERTREGVLLMYAEGPISRTRQRRVTLREEHIKRIHGQTG